MVILIVDFQKQYEGEVIDKKRATKDVYILKIKLDKKISFDAGQFMNIEIPCNDGRTSKAYSIASPPSEREVLEFCIKKIPGGVASTYLCNLVVGSKIRLSGPFGFFTMKNCNSDCIFVATGTGIAGIKPMIEDMLSNGCKNNIILVFGARKDDDIYYRELFYDLSENYNNFRFIPTLSRPNSAWKGIKGYVQQWIKDNVVYNGQHIYICGLIDMVDEVLIVDR